MRCRSGLREHPRGGLCSEAVSPRAVSSARSLPSQAQRKEAGELAKLPCLSSHQFSKISTPIKATLLGQPGSRRGETAGDAPCGAPPGGCEGEVPTRPALWC